MKNVLWCLQASLLIFSALALLSGCKFDANGEIKGTVGRPTQASLSYSINNDLYYLGVAITSVPPTLNACPTVSAYSITPALPTGLSFNTTTGTISGTPSTNSTLTTYTVNATCISSSSVSKAVSASFSFSITTPITSTTTLNSYAYVTDANFSGSVINVDTTAGFAISDKVMVIQMQDYDVTNNAGNYEFATVSALTATQFTLTSSVSRTYYSNVSGVANAQVTQIVKVAQYSDLVVNSGGLIQATAWNGQKGGIVALEVSNRLILNGTGLINVNGVGFRGSLAGNNQGESYLGFGAASLSPNGGGGGGNGGGSAAGASYGTSGSSGSAVKGLTYGIADLSKIFLGSGGGEGAGSDGGNGGGALYISAPVITLNGTGTISSNGNNGVGVNGGSGSGGSIKILASTSASLGTGLVLAKGGTSTLTGGNGRIYISSPSITGDSIPLYYGASGNIIISGITAINLYSYITSASTSGFTATVDTTSGFSVGDKVMVIQMQDFAATDSTGTYEFKTIQSLTSTQFTFTTSLANTYYSALPTTANAQVAQIVKVPSYTSITINSGGVLVPQAWNGKTGGILIFDSTGAVTLNGTGSMSANGMGYSGGTTASRQGESYPGSGSTSCNANGGGGGADCVSSIGAGASYGTSGSQNGGAAGLTYGSANLSKIFLGSGGSSSAGRIGGAGGGIISFTCDTLSLTGTGGITSNGINGTGTMGGSGSGGSIKISATASASIGTGLVLAQGGTSVPTGGTGRISISSPSVTGDSAPLYYGYSFVSNLTIPSGIHYINAYAFITDATTAGSTINLESTDGFSVGDKVLVIQMQDYDVTNNAGTYEFKTIQSLTSTQMVFTAVLTNTYYSNAARIVNAKAAQVVKVPQYTSMTISNGATLSPTAWNGKTGGILIFDSAGAVTLNGTGSMSANSMGFVAYFQLQGESYLGKGQALNTNRAGGGGMTGGAAGAGGGHATAGANGGGTTGGTAYGVANLSKIYLGSAGGDGASRPAGKGGGIIYFTSDTLTLSGTGGVTANGGSGFGTLGGSGAGGSIYSSSVTSATIGVGLITATGGSAAPAGGDGRIRIISPSTTGTSTPAFVP